MSNALIQGMYNDNGKPVPRELKSDVSKELVVISHEHSKVHEGNLFSTGYLNAALADNADLELLITTHANYSMHTYMFAACGGEAIAYVYEGPTITANGTALTPTNNNRTKSNVPNCSIYHTPTTSADGTQLDAEVFIPGGTGGNAVGGNLKTNEEQYVLAPNTSYLLRLTNVSGLARIASLHLTFYEIPG